MSGIYKITQLLLLFLCISTIGCERDSKNFSGTGKVAPLQVTLKVPCTENQETFVLNQQGTGRDIFRIETKWCFKTKKVSKLRILFLIDESKSMYTNDAVISNSCGRLDAINTLINIAKQRQGSNPDDIEVGLITFGSTARKISDFKTSTNIKPYLTAETICRENDETNYSEALRLSGQMIQNKKIADQVPIPATIYMITDGGPSRGLGGVSDPGKIEAQLLQEMTTLKKDLVLVNVLFLKPKNEDPAPAEQLLARMTKDPSRVVAVEHAHQLSRAIESFKLPLPKLKNGGVSAVMKFAGQSRNIGIAKTKDNFSGSADQETGISEVSTLTDPFSFDLGHQMIGKFDMQFDLRTSEGLRTRKVQINFERSKR